MENDDNNEKSFHPVVTRLSIDSPPNKTTYFVGETFDPTGMVVRVHFNNGTSEVLPSFSYSPTGPLAASDSYITVTFSLKTVSQPITVNYSLNNCYIGNASIGDNPSLNLMDFSVCHVASIATVERDSYQINLSLIYQSNLPTNISNLIEGFPIRFKTNFHQFMIMDGEYYKHIDENGHIRTFSLIAYNLYHDTDGLGLVYNAITRIIQDEKGNELGFDGYGRLISIQSGICNSNKKTITYSNGKIFRVYDNRESGTELKFEYSNGVISEIAVYYLTNNLAHKAYYFNYTNNLLTSITEEINNQSRTIYEYSYDSNNYVNEIKDTLIDDYYRMLMSYNSSFGRRICTSLQFGHYSGTTFVPIKTYTQSSFYLSNSSAYPLSRQTTICNINNKYLTFSIDKRGNVISTFEKEQNSDHYLTLLKDKGVYIDNGGTSPLTINGSHLCSTPLSVNQGLSSTSLDGVIYLKLSFYLRLTNIYHRVKINLSSPGFDAVSVYVNSNAYLAWQKVEIPFIRNVSDGVPTAFSSFTISICDINNSPLAADIANIHFEKDAPRQKLYFENNSSAPICFDDLDFVRLYSSSSEYTEYGKATSPFFMNENDLLRTLKDYNAHIFQIYLAFFNGGQAVKTWSAKFEGISNNNQIINFLSANNLDNSVFGNNKNWYFAANPNDVTKTYYRFHSDTYDIVTRRAYVTSNNEIVYKENIKTYNYKDQIRYTKDEKDVETYYEYFSDGQLKKKYVEYVENSQTKTIVLYEATLDNNNKYISRKTEGRNSYDYRYSGYLQNKIIVNGINQEQPFNSDYFVEETYDNFLSHINSVEFINDDVVEEKHHFLTEINNRVHLLDDNVSYYTISKSSDHRSTFLAIDDGDDIVTIFSINETTSSRTTTYNNSYNGPYVSCSIVETFNSYNKPASIVVNNTVMTSFAYQVNNGSYYSYLLTYIEDNFINEETDFYYDNHGELTRIIKGSLDIQFYESDGYKCTKTEYDSDETYITKEKDDEIKIVINGQTPFLFDYKYSYDSLSRLTRKRRTLLNVLNIDEEFEYLSDYPLLVSSYSFSFVSNIYSETYSYDQSYCRLTSIQSNLSNIANTATYQYDLLGRLTSETNVILGINRTYIYKSLNNVSGPVGRMISFGNKSLQYDPMGRLSSFDNVSYEYDYCGNRRKRSENNVDTYFNWVRGCLLASVGSTSFTYDYQGLRHSKTDSNGNSHFYYYNGSKLIGEDIRNSSNVTVTKLRYFYDKDGLSGFSYNGTLYSYVRNPFNDIVAILGYGTNGITVEATYIYDAWGNHKIYNADGTEHSLTDESFVGNINPFRYRSYYYDKETNLYYLKTRYYDSEIGLFISPDDFDYLDINNISGFDLYAYCRNNPVMYFDPFGHSLILLVATILLFVKTTEQVTGFFGSLAVQLYSHGFNVAQWDWRDLIGRIVEFAITGLVDGTAFFVGAINPMGGLALYSNLNNIINGLYYNILASSNNDIADNSYNAIYLTRWQRLDFVKKMYGTNYYGYWEFYHFGEFSLHMQGFYFMPYNESTHRAEMAPCEHDTRWFVIFFSWILGVLGF